MIVIAGAGIGGMTAALALAKTGWRVQLLEQAQRLEEAGAGIQLTPNATRILFDLGLQDALAPHSVTPQEIRIRNAASGRLITSIPLGEGAQQRYGAPYWIVHRQDLQAVLRAALEAHPAIDLALGCRVDNFAAGAEGVTVRHGARETRADALIGADGVWSAVRRQLAWHPSPRFCHRVAWRAVIPATNAPVACTGAHITLWLGAETHLVHYPISGGRAVNMVAITREESALQGWSHDRARENLLARFPRGRWADAAREALAAPDAWQCWALHEGVAASPWGEGPVTLLGDAAHAMLPFLAQGAGMAIEDAAVLAAVLRAHATPHEDAASPTPVIAQSLRRYENLRHARTRRAQRAAARNGSHYHRGGFEAAARDLALRLLGGARLRHRYDWIYDWRVDAPPPANS